MPLTMTVPDYHRLNCHDRREFDAWLEEATALPLDRLRAKAVTLLDEGGTIEVEREHDPVRLVGEEILVFRERYLAGSLPPHFVAS